ncbi:phytoene desaturase family protein [Streptomyces sp. WM6378]|uniref:phytoene desaturase family protein n=1 Tax=Streptomyces sp. WM6378 TaxID=1415557 RepID=UPI0006AF9A20|nr:NAD(P)/FAD-dependent oxidoreductase [Streptomyces sp. WM6378]KOU40016.1 phytoene dehydrogenase [Streptomyces sp. WM6378]
MARIAVIGAGVGAMAAAARLAVAGHRVTVYERSSTYGGALGRFERDGFVFDTGPGLLRLPAVYRDLFVKTGKEPLESRVELAPVDPASRHLFADGTQVSLPNASRAGVMSALDAALGAGAGERWGAFLIRAREAWDRTRRPLLEEPLWPNWQVLAREPYPAPKQRRLLRAPRQAATLGEVAAWELGGGHLGALLENYALEYGLDPSTAPASAAVLPYMEQTFGSWYVRGGMRELARAVYERCLARKVEFVFDAEVTRVNEKDGRAAGVELADGTAVEADHVVCGADPRGLERMLPGRELWAPGTVRPAATARPSRFTVLLALRGARPSDAAHRTVVHSPSATAEARTAFAGTHNAPPTVTVLRPDDPAVRPDDGHEAVTLTATVAPDGPVDWTDEALVQRYADELITAAARAVPELRERLLWHESRTPVHIAEATGAGGGSVPAPSLAAAEAALLHPSNTTALPGLYLAGGWAHPGGGLAHAGMSGALVTGLIVEGDDFRGSQ